MDPSEAGELAQDRAEWKGMILDRMKHLETYEEQKGHQYRFAPEEEVLVRNAHRRAPQVEEGFLCESRDAPRDVSPKRYSPYTREGCTRGQEGSLSAASARSPPQPKQTGSTARKHVGDPPKDWTSGGVTRAARVSARTT